MAENWDGEVTEKAEVGVSNWERGVPVGSGVAREVLWGFEDEGGRGWKVSKDVRGVVGIEACGVSVCWVAVLVGAGATELVLLMPKKPFKLCWPFDLRASTSDF